MWREKIRVADPRDKSEFGEEDGLFQPKNRVSTKSFSFDHALVSFHYPTINSNRQYSSVRRSVVTTMVQPGDSFEKSSFKSKMVSVEPAFSLGIFHLIDNTVQYSETRREEIYRQTIPK